MMMAMRVIACFISARILSSWWKLVADLRYLMYDLMLIPFLTWFALTALQANATIGFLVVLEIQRARGPILISICGRTTQLHVEPILWFLKTGYLCDYTLDRVMFEEIVSLLYREIRHTRLRGWCICENSSKCVTWLSLRRRVNKWLIAIIGTPRLLGFP